MSATNDNYVGVRVGGQPGGVPEACGGVTTPTSYVFARDRSVTTEDFNKFKEEIKSMITSLWAAQKEETKNSTSTLLEIKNKTSNIENSIALLTSQNQELNKKVIQMENKIKEGNEHLALLEDKIENMQMAYRKSNFEIKNVPRKADETKDDLVDMVLHLSATVGADLNKSDIRDVYRVLGKKDQQQKNTPIVVETSSTLIKNNTLKLCKAFNVKTKSKLCAKHLGLRVSEDTPIFVSEQLTAKGSRLHFLARDLVKSKQYKYCWTAYGRVYVRESDNSKIINIKSEAQVHQLMNKK
ncbi:uncharacterized protein LOC135086436 [Ostrinia nubilalis]|uniref:uncharacterized protein LOC135086436 n=1 Tax=Ostrinia nubilalis TaxID=29057 RepID=UPI00308252A2